ncbi:hypothetical protein RvY_17185 [Ramazzottius varieornatus]|uniref:Uncharacterized protein n=1 Tax=Ramazzottius varieornatus TaxID=947166 RepID=A0A1D1W7C0_RAMVA|nr:hypothetical protein RvY_17185 [Ramazzottius varieornatus]
MSVLSMHRMHDYCSLLVQVYATPFFVLSNIDRPAWNYFTPLQFRVSDGDTVSPFSVHETALLEILWKF